MTKTILERIARVLRPRVDIWQPRAWLSAQDGYDLWYGAYGVSRPGRRDESRRCCSDFPR